MRSRRCELSGAGSHRLSAGAVVRPLAGYLIVGMENSMTGSLPNKELDRAALAAGHFEIAEQDGLPFDLDRLNKELLEKGLEPFTAMSEVLQAVKEWQTFQAQATPRA